MTLNFFLSTDLFKVERSGYTLLDLLADIGGMQGMLFSVFGTLASFLNKDYFDNRIVAKLYKYHQASTDHKATEIAQSFRPS